MWRFRYALKRARLRLARLSARSPRVRLVRRSVPWIIVVTALGGLSWYAAGHPERLSTFGARGDGEAGARIAALRLAASGLSLRVDVDAGRAMLEGVLPPLAGSSTGPEPAGSWRTPLRAWVYAATGYDFASPRTFLEAEVPGFRSTVERGMDVVLVPGGQSQGGAPQAGQPGGGRPAGVEEPAIRSGTIPSEGPLPGEGPFGALPGAPPGSPGVPGGAPLLPGVPAKGASPALPALAAWDWGREPLVLIYHSHTSESYRTSPPDPRATPLNHIYDSSDTGIVRVGRALAEKLQEEYGIPSIHSTRVHNWPHHARAYLNSRETVQEILREHPSIKVVLDLHRQGVPDYTYATTVDGVDAVGIDIIYTTGLRAGYPNPHWRSNEAFALRLAGAMDEVHPGLLRRVMKVDDSVYNQDLHPHMLLLEIGNYLDFEEHAVAAARLLADAIASALHEIMLEEEGAEVGAQGPAARAGQPGPVGGLAPAGRGARPAPAGLPPEAASAGLGGGLEPAELAREDRGVAIAPALAPEEDAPVAGRLVIPVRSPRLPVPLRRLDAGIDL